MANPKIRNFGLEAELDVLTCEWKSENADFARWLNSMKPLFECEPRYFPNRFAAFFDFVVARIGGQVIEAPEQKAAPQTTGENNRLILY